ncbi:MAG: PQQ-binding-like beta-propeller repeat protein, partial [Planctomycetaceae bacterium]|nr:PQQ-binding-like beta-propeller repeat protein [Planctomycetaceae bacterium]
MKHQLGVVLQFLVLIALPMLCYWQLQFGFPLIWMPGLLLVGVVLFTAGTWLRRVERPQIVRTSHALLVVAMLHCVAVAQDAPRRPFREAVTLAVDAEAARTLLTLEDRWAAGQWEAALDTLIELSETRGRSLVQTDAGDGGGLARYVRAQLVCDRFLAALPPDGLADYRRRIEPRAQRLWDAWTKTGDVAALQRLSDQMFYSRYGDRAAWELGQRAWDRGELSAARSHWKSLLPAENAVEAGNERRYPDSSIPPADIAARLILCDVMEGHLPAARAALARFATRYPDDTGTLAGRDGKWSDLLTAELRAAESWAPVAHEDDIPTFSGSTSRGFRSPASMDLGSELWTAALPGTRLPTVPRVSLYPTAPPLAYHPAVVDDVVYLNDGLRIFGWRLDSGLPAWGGPLNTTGQIFPAIEVEGPQEPRRPVTGAPRWTVTVDGGRLYARMGSAVTTPSPLELRDQRTELVCLDVGDGEGRLLWSKTGDDLAQALPDHDEAPLWSWEGTPVAHNGRLYAVLSRRRPQLAWSVMCLDAETGLVLWQRPVGITRPTPPDNENLATQLLLTLGDGRLFLSTDWGAIAALDAEAGHLLWAVSYESEPLRLGAGQPAPRWIGPPCLLSEGNLFAAPLDSDHVFCLDAQTGLPRWRVNLPDRIRHLLGVANGRLMLSGDALWGLDISTGDNLWNVRPTEPEQFGYGRGWLAGDVVYWPSREALSVVDQRTGQVLREQPLLTPDARRFGGNVIVSGGVLLIASADRLTAYGEYARNQDTQQQKLSRQPDDNRARRRLADIATNRGDYAIAREWLAAIEPRDAFASLSRNIDEGHRPAARSKPASTQPVALVRTERVVTSGYWTRAWHRDLSRQSERVLMPHGTPSSPEHATVLVQSATLSACDRRTGQARWTTPLDRPVLWAAYGDDLLLWATADELIAARLDSGAVVYRVPWRAELARGNGVAPSTDRLRFARCGDAVVLTDTRSGLLVCDVATGAIQWRHRFAEPPDGDTLSLGADMIGWHPDGRGLAAWRSVTTGQLVFGDKSPTEPWRRSPV